MKILVTAASKHGATAEIADVIGNALAERGHHVAAIAPETAPAVDDFDAVIVGSAVYAGHWMKEAKELVADNAALLSRRPVWLFSSGPVGEPLMPREEAVDVSEMMQLSGAREHRTFAGKIDKKHLGFGERALVAALHAAVGDFRNWDEIRAWATGIAVALERRATEVRQ